MTTPVMRLLGVLTVLGALTAGCPVEAQSAIPAAGETWQPYRGGAPAVTLASAAGLETPPATVETEPIRTAQLPPEEGFVCPQPIFCAPVCEVPCCPPALAYVDPTGAPPSSPQFWQWRVLPAGVIWQSYWAGVHEPRLAFVPYQDTNNSTNFGDVSLGGRASLFRYGTDGPERPQGFELQAEGAAFPRLNFDENWDLEAVDFRGGFPLIYGREQWQAKASYYHLSSHMGDEFALRNSAITSRINYSRDCLVLGLSYYPLPAWRWYAEAGWAFHYDVSQPWEFQFGVDVAKPGPTGALGTPFVAINGHIREELNYGGNVVAQLGWLWRGNSTGTLRTGFHYFNGKSNEFEFYRNFEQQVGGGLWYDF